MGGIHLCMSESFQPHAMQICSKLILNNYLFCQYVYLAIEWNGLQEKGPPTNSQNCRRTKTDCPVTICQLLLYYIQEGTRVTHIVYYLCTTQHMVPVIKEMVVYVQHASTVTETRMPIVRLMITCLLHIALSHNTIFKLSLRANLIKNKHFVIHRTCPK